MAAWYRLIYLLLIVSPVVHGAERAASNKGIPGTTYSFLMELHVSRLIIMAKELYRFDPDAFKVGVAGVSREDLVHRLSVHDPSKRDTSAEFRSHYDTDLDSASIPAKLGQLWGKKLGNGHPWIDEVNEIDRQISMQFDLEKGWLSPEGDLSPEADLMNLAEEVVDRVDRGKDKLASVEFGKEMTLASQMYPEGSRARGWAEHLEANYERLVGHLLVSPEELENLVMKHRRPRRQLHQSGIFCGEDGLHIFARGNPADIITRAVYPSAY